jgi:heme exporter protein C
MNRPSALSRLVLWFNQTGSPPNFDRFAARWTPWAFAVAMLLMALGTWGGLYAVPADYKQGENFRILYIHVPSAWMSLFVFVVMAVQALIALVWRIKACEILAMACAPVGAAFTLVTLLTGSIWGKPTWGTWWTWDPRLTSELVLLFLYVGVMGLYNAIEDRRAAARAACFLALVGVVNVPIVHYAVQWWNTLHQGETIRLVGPSKLDASMLWPLLAMAAGTKAWFVGSLLQRARALNLEHESSKDWVRASVAEAA